MIEAIKEIGEYALKKQKININNPLNVLIDNPASKGTKNILIIILENSSGEIKYKYVDSDEFDGNKLDKYLYKRGKGSAGSNLTPTTKIAESLKRTFSKNILGWFKKYDKIGTDNNINFLVKIGDCLKKNEDKIFKDLESSYNKENNIITIKIDNKYLGEYEIFREILVEESIKGFYFIKSFKGDNSISKANNQTCCVCKEKESEVYGFVDTYKFYTVDKQGFVSGGFQQRDAWKNYPVCLNCALTLEAGKKYLQNNLTFNFYGFKYHLIPKFINEECYENKESIFGLIKKWQDPKFRKKDINILTTDEKEIFELMSEQKNYVNMNFMFYEKSNAALNILLYIEDVLPSRLKKLFEVKREVDRVDIFKECLIPIFENKKKVGEKPMEFNFGIVRTIFPKISNMRTYNQYFLDITKKIIANKQIDYNFILQFIMQKIREEFVNSYQIKSSTLKGFMLINYLYRLGIIKPGKKNDKEVSVKDDNKKNDLALYKIDDNVDKFFKEFAEFFNSDAKKAVFLEGVLVQLLLNIQYKERKATPFRIKLKGLKLNEKQIKKLLPEIQNKLEEYGKNYYKTLESIISNYFVSAGNGWKLTNDEISFYFVLGMNLSYLFKKENNNKEEDNNE